MYFLRAVLRVFTWLFETVLCGLSVVVAGLAVLSGSELHLGWLPWSADHLTSWMIGLGLFGLLCVALSLVGTLRFLLFFFAIYVFYLLLKGFFVNLSYSFSGPDQARHAALLTAGAFVAIIGAWPTALKRANSRVR